MIDTGPVQELGVDKRERNNSVDLDTPRLFPSRPHVAVPSRFSISPSCLTAFWHLPCTTVHSHCLFPPYSLCTADTTHTHTHLMHTRAQTCTRAHTPHTTHMHTHAHVHTQHTQTRAHTHACKHTTHTYCTQLHTPHTIHTCTFAHTPHTCMHTHTPHKRMHTYMHANTLHTRAHTHAHTRAHTPTTHNPHTRTHTCARACALETKVLPLRNFVSGLSTHPCCVPVFVRTQKLLFLFDKSLQRTRVQWEGKGSRICCF